MDLSFQQTYGGWLLRHKGTADHWSPLEQIWVAVRASRVARLLAVAEHGSRLRRVLELFPADQAISTAR